MRILHADAGRQMRGGQYQVLFLLRGLRDRGHFQTLAAHPQSPLWDRAAAEGFPVVPLGALTLRRLSRTHDLTHAHDARSHTLAWIARAQRLVVARRVAFPVKQGFLSRLKYAYPAGYIAVSDYVRRCLAATARVRVVYDGAPELAPAPATGRIIAPETSDPRKGSALLQGMPVAFSRDLTGDVPGAAAFVYLSYEEGLGSAVLLAMSCGVPVVASRVGGLPELIEHERTGLLVDNDPPAIRQALDRLAADPSLAARIAAEARKRYHERFTVDQMVENTLQAYQDLLS